MELQNADTLRWHVYEILTNDVPVSTAIGRDLIGVASCRGSALRAQTSIFRGSYADIEIGKDSRAF